MVKGESVRAVLDRRQLAPYWIPAGTRDAGTGREYTYQYKNMEPAYVITVKVMVTVNEKSEVTVKTNLILPNPYQDSNDPMKVAIGKKLAENISYADLNSPEAKKFLDEIGDLDARIAEVGKAFRTANDKVIATNEQKFKDEEKRLKGEYQGLIALQKKISSPYSAARTFLRQDPSFQKNVCFAEKPQVVIERKYREPDGTEKWLRR